MKDKKPLAYYFGYAFGIVCITCATIAVISLTAKFLMWLF